MVRGKVKWFNAVKGYGFLNADNDKRDIFVHFSSVDMEGYKTLSEGEDVEFELVESDRGPQASKVQRLAKK